MLLKFSTSLVQESLRSMKYQTLKKHRHPNVLYIFIHELRVNKRQSSDTLQTHTISKFLEGSSGFTSLIELTCQKLTYIQSVFIYSPYFSSWFIIPVCLLTSNPCFISKSAHERRFIDSLLWGHFFCQNRPHRPHISAIWCTAPWLSNFSATTGQLIT